MNWIHDWALVRQSETAYIGNEKLKINPEFLKNLSHDEFESTFRFIGELIYKMYGNIADNPEKFGLPTYETDKYGYASNEARISWRAPWEPVRVLMYIFLSGILNNTILAVDTAKFREYTNLKGVNKITNINKKIEALTDYGFVITGLKNHKITSSTKTFDVEYPDNPDVLTVLQLVAEKSYQISHNLNYYSNTFYSWNPRILYDEDINDFNALYDKLKNGDDRKFVNEFHELLISEGYSYEENNWNEGPGIRYHTRSVNEPYMFRILKNKFDLQLMARIRNAEKCLEYVKSCPESVKDIFRSTNNGCANKHKGCNKGVRYIFEDEEKWKCGCCNAPFVFHPVLEDIPHYLKLIELGKNK